MILGNSYDGKIDVWSAGCVLAELYNDGEVLFQNESVVELLAMITSICGNFPRHLCTSESSNEFFLKSGLLYEKREKAGGE